MRVIISGGGTGGHIFPAIAIANGIKEKEKDARILFVGAKGKMEMERVPKAGYEIKGLWISGFQRKLTLKNMLFPIKLLTSLWKASNIVSTFKPDVVIGVGGYASGPTLQVANMKGIPTLIQEQNSYPGITNRLLASKVSRVCVAYLGMDRWFAKDKIVFTGNPIRKDILQITTKKEDALGSFGWSQNKKTVLIFGGSLGARSLNNAIANAKDLIEKRTDVQLIWQVGKLYIDEFSQMEVAHLPHVKVLPFIEDMNMAYAAADIIVSRAGALTISELEIVGKPAILVPSPNVAEDHQRKNAMALVNEGAALMVEDARAFEDLGQRMYELVDDSSKQEALKSEIKKMAKPNATEQIVQEVLSLIKK
jgi:UDP-N-acetylglucosamine--N-acetylmuramyl-(pentapeptide) pyrophosphoryl-undecaprenol N-acetylglucosamine transferase